MSGPKPLVMCGPSGAGKSTLLKKLMAEFGERFGFSVSHTTRAPRQGETNGVQYNFVSKEEMLKAIERGEFIEHATFAGNMYGTSTGAVHTVREKGLICVLDIDIQGVMSIKKTDIKSNYVFIMPPSLEVLEQRLIGRGTESEESLRKRLDQASKEAEYGMAKDNFDVVIVNDDLDTAYGSFLAFIKSRYPELQ